PPAPPAAPPPAEPSPTTPAASSTARAVAVDLWMRLYQTVRLGHWWYGAVRTARGLEPDVVHANDANTLVPALLTTMGTPGQVVYDSHELWRRRNTRQDRWLAPAVDALVETVGTRLAAGVITVSPSIATWLQDHYHLAQTPTLVRNIPTARPTPAPAEGRLRELAGLGPEARVVSYTGSITTGRGLEETVDALALLDDDVHLVLLGYGAPQYVDRLLRRARTEGVADRMHLVGSVPSAQVPQTLADADVAVVYVRPICLSYLYSLPNKLFESIHAGLPIVAADLPDTAEVVRRHGVGEVFDARTPADLAAAIRTVLADPGHYRQAAVAAARDLTWEREAARMVALYDRVLTGRAAAR
ncbi:glycosyltransferase, partial [Ornithinimicrobium kibberense]